MYERCRIDAGQITSCSGPFTGTAVAMYGGSLETCQIDAGHVTTGRGPYSGIAVVYVSR